MTLRGAYRRYESSQVFVQMYFTVIHLIHRRFKTRFLDSWPLESRLQAAARPYNSHAFRECVAKILEFHNATTGNWGTCCEIHSFSQRAHRRDVFSLHVSNLKFPGSFPPRAPTPSPPPHLCYQLVKELTGFPPARIGSIVHYRGPKAKGVRNFFGVPHPPARIPRPPAPLYSAAGEGLGVRGFETGPL